MSEQATLIYYFSASWCAPCRAFTPKMNQWAEELKGVVDFKFVSLDRDPEAAAAYASKINFPAVPFDAAGKLRDLYQVRSIPEVIMVRGNTYTPVKQILMKHGTSVFRQ